MSLEFEPRGSEVGASYDLWDDFSRDGLLFCFRGSGARLGWVGSEGGNRGGVVW
jgi:hypothetical protein